MRKIITFLGITALILGSTALVYKDEIKDYTAYFSWCNSIYHQNVGCPLHGMVSVPESVQAEQDAAHLAWCDSIYHRNIGCPQFDQVEVPPEVLAAEEAEHLEWCESIGHRNVSCHDS